MVFGYPSYSRNFERCVGNANGDGWRRIDSMGEGYLGAEEDVGALVDRLQGVSAWVQTWYRGGG